MSTPEIVSAIGVVSSLFPLPLLLNNFVQPCVLVPNLPGIDLGLFFHLDIVMMMILSDAPSRCLSSNYRSIKEVISFVSRLMLSLVSPIMSYFIG